MGRACMTLASEIGDRDYVLPEDVEIAKANGISYNTLYARVNDYGWNVLRARTEKPVRHQSFQPVWQKWKATAELNGVGREVFYDRVRRQGVSEERAATLPVSKGGQPSRWSDKQLELMEMNGLSANLVNTRITRLGWTQEQALNTPKVSEKERAKRVAEGTRKYHRERGVNREFNKTV